MATVRYVAVVGSRTWGRERVVSDIVRWLLHRGFGVITGGALGADTHALAAVLLAGAVDRARVILPWPVALMPRGSRGSLRAFAGRGGRVDTVLAGRPGYNSAAAALRVRTELVVDASCGVVAFLHGATPGTWFTIRYAVGRGLPVVVMTASGRVPRSMPGGRWVAVTDGPLAGGFRWTARRSDDVSDGRPLRTIVVAESRTGMPVHDTVNHISALAQGDRLWFERCEVAGDTIVAPHPNESDGRPSFLTVPAIRKRFGCDAATALDLGELFLTLEADEGVVAHYAADAHRWGVDTVRRDLFRLVVQLALLTQADDPADDADPYREEGDVDEEAPALSSVAYHVVGYLGSEPEVRPWIETQPAWFRDLIGRIDACPSLPDLAELGRAIYGMSLTHDQAGAAWTHYRVRKDELYRDLRLSTPAASLLSRIAGAAERALPQIGTHLYRLQRNGLGSLPSHEWAVLWGAYQSRKATMAPAT